LHCNARQPPRSNSVRRKNANLTAALLLVHKRRFIGERNEERWNWFFAGPEIRRLIMNRMQWKVAAMSLAVPGLIAAAAPAVAMPFAAAPQVSHSYSVEGVNHSDRGRDRQWSSGREYRDARYNRGYYGQSSRTQARVWRGNDGRYYCRKDNGTTGLLVGAAVGGLLGHEVAGYGDRTLGAILGAAGGGLLGRAIDKGDSNCR
jgi:hypothetical protein